MTLKSLTNSKKIVDIVNRYGHCCSYSILEGIETEATFTSSERSDICPEGMVRFPGLCTGLAFNNFDRFIDTTSGKDTLHDTVGIIFENQDESVIQQNNASITPDSRNIIEGEDVASTSVSDTDSNDGSHLNEEIVEAESNANSSGSKTVKNRRSFHAITHELQPYRKRPRIIESMQPVNELSRLHSPNLQSVQHTNFAPYCA